MSEKTNFSNQANELNDEELEQVSGGKSMEAFTQASVNDASANPSAGISAKKPGIPPLDNPVSKTKKGPGPLQTTMA